VLDPVNGAFNIGAMIRWLDYNDCWLAAEWGHPSDNLGGILAVADWVSRTNRAGGQVGNGTVLTIKDVLEAMVKAHEIQGCLALENSFNKVGLDHVVLVKVATAAVVSKMLGLSERQTADAISQAWVDGQSLRTYRHAPNAMSRKSWAAGDACQRAVNLVLKVQRGEPGVPTVLSAPTWGFYDVLFKGRKFEFQRPYGSYVMENVLFKVSYPAEFHSQTAIEAAKKIYADLEARGKSAEDIKEVTCRTHEACIRIIDKQHKPLDNFADRDHCIQVPLFPPPSPPLPANISRSTWSPSCSSTTASSQPTTPTPPKPPPPPSSNPCAHASRASKTLPSPPPTTIRTRAPSRTRSPSRCTTARCSRRCWWRRRWDINCGGGRRSRRLWISIGGIWGRILRGGRWRS